MFRLLLLNSGSNASVMLVKIIFSFVMAPVIIQALGNYDYGLWEIVLSLIGYMGLLDMGMRPAVTRYVAKYNAVNDKQALGKLLNTAFFFNLTIGTIACTILIILAINDPHMLAENSTKESRYIYFLLIIAFQLLFQFPGHVAECIHLGHQRYYLTNNITILNNIIGNTILYYLLTHGYGLLTLALGNCIGLSLKYILYFLLLSLERYGGYALDKAHFSFDMLKNLLCFGGKTLIIGIVATISGGMTPLIIGSFLGPAAVPFYSLPARLVTYIRDITMTVANVFMPMFSHLKSLEKGEQLREIYLQATKYIAAVTSPMTIGAMIMGPYFIHVWIGPEYAEKSNYIFYFLGVGTLLYIFNPLFHRFMTGIDKLNFLIFTRVLFLLILLSFTFFLITPYGNNGVAFAIMLSYCFIAPLELWYACRNLNISIKLFVKSVYLPLIIPNVCMFFFVSTLANNIKPYSYFKISIIVLPSALIYFILFFIFSMTKEEKASFYAKAKGAIA